MKKNLTKNIPLKIMSIIVGILVWLIVVNVDDPIITKGFVISDVQIINEAYVDQLGEMVMQDDRENSVRVYITGDRKTVNRLTSSDIKAVADLQQAQSTDTDPVMIPITATCSGILPENISVSPQNLSVHLEKKNLRSMLPVMTASRHRGWRLLRSPQIRKKSVLQDRNLWLVK